MELRFRPEVVEQLATATPPLRRRVRATVTLSAGGVSAKRVLDTEVRVHALRIPSLLALFRHKGFAAVNEGAVLVVAPSNSPLTSVGAARTAVENVRHGALELAGFARFATLAQRVGQLASTLQAHSHAKFLRADAIANLNQITLIQNGPLTNDIEAEDEASSLILLGPSARRARLYVKRNLDGASGRLDVSVDDANVVLIADLHAKAPASVPSGRAHVEVEPKGNKTFGDELSSLELQKPAFIATLTGTATLTIDDPLAGTASEPVTIDLAFSADHRSVTVDRFPPIAGDSATISLDGPTSGTFDPGTGAMTLNLRLKLDTLLGPAFIALPLTTTAPLNPETLAITLAAASVVEAGALHPLNGDAASVVLAGTLDQLP